jgi:transcriptional regulator with XRE-family HTH domain
MINDIGNRILTLRKNLNLSQESLAEQIGVSRQAISKWERGEATPDIYNTTALAEVFNLSIDEFIHGEESESLEKKPKIIALDLKKNAERLILIAIAIFLLSAFGFIVLPFSDNINILVFGLMITSGTLIIVKSAFMLERFYMYNKDNLNSDDFSDSPSYQKISLKRKNAIITIVSLLCVMTYLFISFVYGLWHPGWLVFLLIPIFYSIIEVIEANREINK